jgi:hypothetical protein
MENLQGLSIEGIIQEKEKDLTGYALSLSKCLTRTAFALVACGDKDAGWSGVRGDLPGRLRYIFMIYSGACGRDLRRGFFRLLWRVPPTSSYWLESSP